MTQLWTMLMLGLLQLPLELGDSVCSQLDKASLLALCGSCKTLKPIAERALYREIPFGSKSIRFPELDSREAPHLLLRTLLHRPNLRPHVRHYQHCGPRQSRVKGFSEEDLTLVRSTIESIQLTDLPDIHVGSIRRYWIKGIERGATAAVIGLLLLQFSALESLRLEFDPRILYDSSIDLSDPPFPYIGAALLIVVELSLPLSQTLKSIIFTARHSALHALEHATLDTRELSCVFVMPNIRHMALTHVSSEAFPMLPKDRIVLHKLESLSISRSQLHLDNLQQLICAADRLSCLEYRAYTTRSLPLQAWLDCTRLTNILLQRRPTLERLVLTTTCDSANGFIAIVPADHNPNTQLQSLCEFTKLEFLAVPLTTLLSPSTRNRNHITAILPPSLRDFTIQLDIHSDSNGAWTAQNALNEICSWLADWRSSTPLLQRFEIVAEERFFGDQMDQIEELCNKTGLEFVRDDEHQIYLP